jgi:hypothetical protein
MNLKAAVEYFKIPFALSLSKGGRNFEILNNIGESIKAVHASASSARTVSSRFNCGF